MQRATLGISAAALLLGALGVWAALPDQSPVWGAMLRVGIVLGVVWMAVPNFKRISDRVPKWLLFATVVGACVVLWKWQTLFVVGPILVALWMLVPKWLGQRK